MLDNLEMLIAFAVVMLGLSLIITILTQMMAALLGSRGTNLRWGLTQLLNAVHPEFARSTGAIVDKVLTDSLATDSVFARFQTKAPLLSRWRLASTIRVEEVVGILERLSAGTTPLPAGNEPPANYTLEQAMATMARDARAKAGHDLRNVAAEVKQFLGAVSPVAAGTAPSGGAVTKTTAADLFMNLQPTVKIDELIGKVTASDKVGLDGLSGWFKSAMDRAAQRFTTHMRIWTIFFAIGVAFALQLDSFNLFRQLSTNEKLRTGLTASYSAVLESAAQVAPTTEANKATLQQLSAQADKIRGQLEESGFSLIPPKYAEWNIWPGAQFDNPRFWGILFSAALLSLGAPFWFNALKSLSSLRPLLASKEAAERAVTPAAV